jgi:hypothetical protein
MNKRKKVNILWGYIFANLYVRLLASRVEAHFQLRNSFGCIAKTYYNGLELSGPAKAPLSEITEIVGYGPARG